MFGGGRGPMGGGGGMLRAVGRAMTRTPVTNGGIQDPFTSSPSSSSTSGNASGGCAQKRSSSSTLNNLTISTAPVSLLNLPVGVISGLNGGGFTLIDSGVYDEFEWVSEEEDESVFGSVPSVDEVQDAFSALQQVFDGSSYSHLENSGRNQSPMVHQVPSFGSDLDWVEPSMQLCHSRVLQPHAYDQVYNAFDLLRTEPSIQRMVISLSSDKSVWEAVMNNEVVREIRELYNNSISEGEESSDETPGENNAAIDFIKWVFDNTMVKATQVFEKITQVMTQLFNRLDDDGVNRKGKDDKFNKSFEEKLKTSVLISIVVMMVVMVSRACNRS